MQQAGAASVHSYRRYSLLRVGYWDLDDAPWILAAWDFYLGVMCSVRWIEWRSTFFLHQPSSFLYSFGMDTVANQGSMKRQWRSNENVSEGFIVQYNHRWKINDFFITAILSL
jgi:hypothetical protein